MPTGVKTLFIGILVFLSGCNWNDSRQSILVIAVDSLPFDSIPCNEVEQSAGFREICQDMVRFTHAFTPSVLAQPAIASLLTGKYPYKLGVWDNGQLYLKSEVQTNAELAIQKGYRTAFFSGGPPIWRKSGFAQGFELFDDRLNLGQNPFYKNAKKVFHDFLQWMLKHKGQPFYSIIYVPDLQFKNFQTFTSKDVARPRNYQGQLNEFAESIADLIKTLKEQGVWNQTWVFVVGLNGRSSSFRVNSLKGTNLFHENTRITAFIKPPQKLKDKKNPRTIDEKINLVDLGKTFFDILGQKLQVTSEEFKVYSLKEKILGQKLDPMPKRTLLFESGWASWRNIGGSLFAVQRDSYLAFYQEPLSVYNTIVDRDQLFAMKKLTPANQTIIEEAFLALQNIGFEKAKPLLSKDVEKFLIGQSLFQTDFKENLDLRKLLKNYKGDPLAQGWILRWYFVNQDWHGLLDYAQKNQLLMWTWLAEKKLDKPVPFIFEAREMKTQLGRDLIERSNRMDKNSKEKLAQSYRQFLTDQMAQLENLKAGYIWDTQLDKIAEPTEGEMILSLDEFSKIKLELLHIEKELNAF